MIFSSFLPKSRVFSGFNRSTLSFQFRVRNFSGSSEYDEIIRPDNSELPDKVHPHMFRRTRATNLYQNDIELELVSRILSMHPLKQQEYMLNHHLK